MSFITETTDLGSPDRKFNKIYAKELVNGIVATTQTAGDNSDKVATTGYVDNGLSNKASLIDTNFSGSEKWYSGTSGTIDLSNGNCQQTSATSITMPTAPTSTNGYATTVTLFCTATNTIIWSNNIIWAGGEAPNATGNLLVTLYGANGHWYGTGVDFTQG